MWVIKLQIDLGVESAIGAERDLEKIAVEIKSFISEHNFRSTAHYDDCKSEVTLRIPNHPNPKCHVVAAKTIAANNDSKP
jgi:hypothetical protein